MANSSTNTSTAKRRDRLQLLDPRTIDEDNLPNLRASLSLESSPSSDVQVREQAARDWQALQAQPEDILNERKETALAREQLRSTLQENTGLKSQLLAARKQLEAERGERLQHPVVYGLGAALVGMTGLWLYQRRKTIAAGQQPMAGTLGLLASKQPAHSKPNQPKLTATALEQTPTQARPQTLPSPSFGLETEPQSLHAPWYKKLLGANATNARQPRVDANTPAYSRGNSHYPDSMDTHIASTLTGDADDSEFSDPEFVKDELIAHLALTPTGGQSAIGHLYELRATVQTLKMIEQEDAARDLLLRHIDALPNTSAWVYLEYLSLCALSDKREAFESMRQRFRVQFNRLAPYWMESPDSQRDLMGHERAVSEITAVWPSQRALSLIENWLTDSAQERRIFHLVAYDDLFDLYDILTQLDEVQDDLDFAPTVSLLDLDFEFAMDLKLEAEPEGTARAVPTVKTGDFDVDVNIAFAQSVPATLNPTPQTSVPAPASAPSALL